ncbi:glycosyltransferase family 4 protein [Kineococcus sp. NUM-3379]
MSRATSRLRVVHVAARYLPDLGGIETHIHEVTRRLAGSGEFDVTVLATDRTGELPRWERTPEGVTVVRRRAYPASRDYYAAPGIVRPLRAGRFDVVHVQGVHTLVPPAAMLAARSAGLPYVVSTHTGGHTSGVRSAARTLQWRSLAPLLRGAARILPVAAFEQSIFGEATGLPPERFTVVPNGGSLPPAVDVQPVPGRIVSVGRLERYKGHHRVIEALPLLRRTRPDTHLHILGAGPYEGELRALADRLGVAGAVSIRLVPPNDRAAMSEAVASAQVMAAMSDYEAHPVSVMEALALGVPVVGCDVAGVGDLVREGFVTGVPLRAAAPEIADALRRAQDGGGPASPPRLPTWEDAVAQMAAVYREVAGGRS